VLQACDGYLEPTLEELGQQLREAMPDVGGMLVEQLGSHLLLVSSPEELFQFFVSIRGKSIEACNMKNSSSHVTLFIPSTMHHLVFFHGKLSGV
jgi:hypothetical protein